jgi:hypothetical protein
VERLSLVSWFMLSDGDLWLEDSNAKYNDNTSLEQPIKFPNYQIARFVDDFIEIISGISECTPKELKPLITSPHKLWELYDRVCNKIEKSEATEQSNVKIDYELAINWIMERTIFAIHFQGRPRLSFFRNQADIWIMWKCDATGFWTSNEIIYKQPYNDFLFELRNFKTDLFNAMELQINEAEQINWGQILFDKERLHKENNERMIEFEKCIKVLANDNAHTTNWEKVIEASNI